MNEVFDSILYSDQNPLLPDKRGEDYYAPAYRQLGITEEAFISHYRINYDLHLLSAKVKYLKRSIDNAVTTTLNKLLCPDEQPSQNIVLYRRKKLYETICNYLTDIKGAINKNSLDLDALLITKDYSQTLQLNECTYIFHYMILALIRCYMEFQHHFIEYIEEDKQLSISDFYAQVLLWQMPSEVGIKEIVQIEVPVVEEKPKRKQKSQTVILSFKYVKTKGRQTDNIDSFREELIYRKLIPQNESNSNFKHLFLGETVKTPIVWIGNISDLSCLFKLLVNDKKVLQLPPSATIWDVVDNCFVDKNGNHFGKDKLRKQQKPTFTRYKMLEDVATFLP